MNESYIKGVLAKRLRDATHWEVTRHEDKSKSGEPDMIVVGNGFTSRWEVKYGTKTTPWKTKGIQHLTAIKLSVRSHCQYIIFEDDGYFKTTAIADPLSVGNTRKGDMRLRWMMVVQPRFNYDWVISEIVRVHHLKELLRTP